MTNALLPPNYRSLDEIDRETLIEELIDGYSGCDRDARLSALKALRVSPAEAHSVLLEIDHDLADMRRADHLDSL